jgi:hypothetical protein
VPFIDLTSVAPVGSQAGQTVRENAAISLVVAGSVRLRCDFPATLVAKHRLNGQ